MVLASVTFGVCISISRCFQKHFAETVQLHVAKPVDGHSGVHGRPLWHHAEQRAESLAPQLKPEYADYRWQAQKVSHTQSSRPDLWGYLPGSAPRQGAIIDSKYVKKLTASHIRQVKEYAGPPFYAQDVHIVCRTDTVIPAGIKLRGVQIHPVLPPPDKLATLLAAS